MWWLIDFWDWFWYFRRGKIKYKVWDFGDTYCATASDGKRTVINCYGSTPEQAKEMALYRINSCNDEKEKEKELVYKGDGFAIYQDKE